MADIGAIILFLAYIVLTGLAVFGIKRDRE